MKQFESKSSSVSLCP